MKGIKYILVGLLFISFYNCNNELFDIVEEQEVVLIPKKITYTIPSSGFYQDMNYNEIGQPDSYTGSEESFNAANFIYENDKLNEMNLSDGHHGSFLDFFYENDQLSKIECLCGSSGLISLVESFYSYDNNQIFASKEYSWGEFNSVYIFNSSNYEVLVEMEGFTDGAPTSKSEFDYDDEGNITQMRHYLYDSDLDMLVLNYVLDQTFDDKNNAYKYAEPLEMMVEMQIVPYGVRTFLDKLNRFGPNNVTSQVLTTDFNNFAQFNHQFNYIYNNDDYPVFVERTNFGNQLGTYTFEYY